MRYVDMNYMDVYVETRKEPSSIFSKKKNCLETMYLES